MPVAIKIYILPLEHRCEILLRVRHCDYLGMCYIRSLVLRVTKLATTIQPAIACAPAEIERTSKYEVRYL